MKHWLATIAVLLCSLAASAHDFMVGGIYYNITSEVDLTVEVTYRGGNHNSYSNEYAGAVTIPETVTYNGVAYSVTSIGNYAFSGCSSLTSITILEGVTSIGNYVFNDCTALKKIIIEDGITTLSLGYNSRANIVYDSGIGQGLFYDCPLEMVYVGRNLSYRTGADYGSSPFCRKRNLNSVTIGSQVAAIAENAFRDCSSLTSITIPERVSEIGSRAFYNCSGLTSIIVEAINLPSISSDVFYGVDKSIPLYVPYSVILAYLSASYWNEFPNIQGLVGTLPISTNITINQYGSATFCSVYALDFSNVKGLKVYAATGYKTSTGVVTLTRVMTTQPGEGIFIKGEPGEYKVPVMESTDENTLNMLVGTLTKTSVNAKSDDGLYANYKYTIKAGEAEPKFYQFTDGSTLGAGKAYLQIPTAWLPQTSETKSISLRFEEGEGTTDIENSQFTIDNSQLTYDLYGRRVDNPVKGGIYIVGGRKVVY